MIEHECDCEYCEVEFEQGPDEGRAPTEAEKAEFEAWCKTPEGQSYIRIERELYGYGSDDE